MTITNVGTRNAVAAAALGAILLGLPSFGGAPALAAESTEARSSTTSSDAVPRRYVSRHRATLAGRAVAYTVTAGDTILTNPAGEPLGTIFSFAYTVDDPAPGRRPVMFVFNGGPGSSSVWLHLGGLGPRRVALAAPGDPARVRPALVDNSDSPLAVADLVFVDPVGTGFSRVRGKGTAADFYGNNQDAGSVAQFIEQWLTANRRWESPKFLAGESYGTVRASLLTAQLLGESGNTALRGISLDGIVMVGHDGGLLPLDSAARFETNFTTMAATAWYHARVPREGRTFEQFIEAARRFSATELAPAFAAQAREGLAAADLQRIAERMSTYVGLPVDYLRAKNLRVSSMAFSRDLLGDAGQDLSLYDGRYLLRKRFGGDAVGLGGEAPPFEIADDPQIAQIAGPFATALHVYLTTELGVTSADQYVLLARVEDQWKNAGPRVDPGDALVNGMRRNPDLNVLFLAGWYDVIAGTAGAAERAVETRLPRGRASVKAYPSGHMCYLGEMASPVGRDVSEFVVRVAARR